eukprot:CAMPEP_0172496716 /NCGR_PEP_ID=MMETSP1066-20121228/91714_1 /TAXON_ID=671091 /ORGANISM="Coscinodiscus wailesii, Strain CCMP2513" /LENGTH=389 /DNA_ID=CAMNT_0013269145 /DNA_START=84 /DNA_END=1253 /DNA_ORIENTATION=+
MESLAQQIDTALQTKNLPLLISTFSTFHTLGGGERRTLSAHFVRSLTNPQYVTFLEGQIFSSPDGISAVETALTNLPTSVEGGADNVLRHFLFDYLVNQGDYFDAARILERLRMDDDAGSVYFMTAAEKCDVYVKIAECYLEKDETSDADGAVTKAGGVVEDISDPEQHRALILRYKSTYARVLDANRKFLQAASRYLQLSQAVGDVEPEELLIVLGRAATCAILAPSGPQRQRILGLVFKDERLSQLETLPHFSAHPTILKKMYMNQILLKSELTRFESSLAPHQRAIMSDGLTIVERAVIEHNMIAVGKLYATIHFQELGALLGVEATRAETVAARMIVDGMLKGSIDQVDGVLSFEGGGNALVAWDDEITSFCVHLNRVTEAVRVD